MSASLDNGVAREDILRLVEGYGLALRSCARVLNIMEWL